MSQCTIKKAGIPNNERAADAHAKIKAPNTALSRENIHHCKHPTDTHMDWSSHLPCVCPAAVSFAGYSQRGAFLRFLQKLGVFCGKFSMILLFQPPTGPSPDDNIVGISHRFAQMFNDTTDKTIPAKGWRPSQQQAQHVGFNVVRSDPVMAGARC